MPEQPRGLELQDMLQYLYDECLKANPVNPRSMEFFVSWARDFLVANPPTTVNPVGFGNAAVQLTNGVTVTIAPSQSSVVAGTMAPERAGASVRVTGGQRERPRGTVDMTMPQPSVSRTQTQPPQRFDK